MVWLTALLGYCLVCWAVGFVALQLIGGRPVTVDDAPADVPPLGYRKLAIVLVTPLVVPIVACTTSMCMVRSLMEIRTLRRIQRSVREYEFAQVNVLHLDQSIRERFETLTPLLIKLGFDLIGDYRMKPEPVESHDRIFLSAAGDTLGIIGATLGKGTVGMISVLEDGSCVHTASVRNPRPERTFEPADQLCLTYLPGASPDDVYRQHQEKLRELTADTGTAVLHLRREQFREAMVYDQRIFNRWRRRHGSLDHEPPAPDFQTLCHAAAP